MKVLAIETSCDETAVAVLEVDEREKETRFRVLGSMLYSQATKHAEYGGVYPTLAKREHQKNLVPLTTEALKQANLYTESSESIDATALTNLRDEEFTNTVQDFLSSTKNPEIDMIAVTRGPGLEPALWTGVTFAESIGRVWNTPVIGVNHMEGHIFSSLIDQLNTNEYVLPERLLPILALLISGGHTELVSMTNWFNYVLIGRTRDDAVGEAFDKTARLLGLPYPGGPEIDAHAKRGRESGRDNPITLPRPMIGDKTCDFSFSGLKTAVLYLVRDRGDLSEEDKENIASEFEDAVRDVLVEKTKRALEETGAQTFVVGGGVSANAYITEGLRGLLKEHFPNTPLLTPPAGLTGDNAIMIGVAGAMRCLNGEKPAIPLIAKGSLSLHEN